MTQWKLKSDWLSRCRVFKSPALCASFRSAVRMEGRDIALRCPGVRTARRPVPTKTWRSFWSAVGSAAKCRFWNPWERPEGVGGKAAPGGSRTLGQGCAVGMEGRDIARRCPWVRTARRSVPTKTWRSFWCAVGSAAKCRFWHPWEGTEGVEGKAAPEGAAVQDLAVCHRSSPNKAIANARLNGWVDLALLWGILAIATAIFPTQAQVDPKTTPEYQRGQEQSHVLCISCHVYPEPDLHDVVTWRKQVYPLMYKNARIAGIDVNGSSADKAALEQWRLIWDYYYLAAPTNALPQGPRARIQRELKGFTVEDPKYRRGLGYATMLRIDPATRQIYVGNALTRSLDVLDQNGKGLASLKLDSTLTHLLREPNGDWLGTQIGMVVPDDRPLGRLTRLTRTGLPFQVGTDVLTNLVRPIESAVGDLTGDGRPDLVVCSYGNLTGVSGKLAWYKNHGDGHYEEHILLDRPGATRCQLFDYNHDGRLDIIALMAQAREGVSLFRNDGGGEFTEIHLLTQPPAWGFVSLQVTDFNGDGHPDLLLGNGDLGDFECPPKRYHGIRIYLNDGHWKFREAFFYPQNGTYQAIAADFDNDSDLDIAAISFFPDYARSPEESFVYLANQGNLEFSAWTFPECERGRWITMDVGDLDGDQDPDIVLGAAYKVPFRTTDELQERWKREGPSLLILRNQHRSPAAAPAK